MKRKKKGFTLVEVLAVITIIGVLLLVTIPTIDSLLLKQRKKLYNEQLNEVEDALKLWGDVNADKLPSDVNIPTIVTLRELKLSGYIKDEYVNPITDKCYANDNNFEISYANGMYNYNVGNLMDGDEDDCVIGYRGVDISSPIVSLEVRGEKRETGWHTSVPYVVVEANDSESGMDRLNWCIGIGCTPSLGNVETTIVEKEDGRKVIEITKAIVDTNGTQVCVEAIDKSDKSSGEFCSEIIRVDTVLPKIDGVVSDITLALNQEIDLKEGVSVREEGSGLEGDLVINPEIIDTSYAQETIVKYEVTDKAGNKATEEMKVIVSATAPEIAYEVADGVINEHGWAKENFYVTIKVKDNSGHGIKEFNLCTATTDTCDPSKGSKVTGKTTAVRLIDVESANNRICVQAKDNYNQTSEVVCSSAYKLDKSKPTVGSMLIDGSSTIKEWYNKNITIAPVAGTDSLSGHLETKINTENITGNINGIKAIVVTKDKAGNVSTKEYTIKVDTGLPEVSIEEPSINGTNGWYKSKPTVVLKGTDGYSGISKIKWCSGIDCIPTEDVVGESKNVTLSDTSGTQVCLIGYDKAGNQSAKKCSNVIKVDTVLPEISGTGSITVALNGTVNLTSGVSVSDGLSGVVSETSYTYNPTSVSTSKAGTTNVTYKAVDKAGNERTVTRSVVVSATAPTITYEAAAGAINEHGWAKGNFYVTIKVKDNSGHGIKEFNVCTATTDTCNPANGSKVTGSTTGTRLIEVESANNRICVQAKDNYNQTSEVVCSSAYKLDKSKPTIGSIKVNGSTTLNDWYTGNVTISAVNGSDSLSGHLSTTVDKTSLSESGSVILKTLDKAGNENTKSFSIKIDKYEPTCSFSALNYIGKNKTASIVLTCTNNISGMSDKTLSASDFTVSNSNISITGVTKEAITKGYKYTITLKGVAVGSATITLPANKVTTVAGLANVAKVSSAITVTSISLSSTSGSTYGGNLTSTITSSNAGTITCSSSNTNVATCSISGSTLTVTSRTSSGSATITLTGSNGSPTATYAITIYYYNPTPSYPSYPSSGTSSSGGSSTGGGSNTGGSSTGDGSNTSDGSNTGGSNTGDGSNNGGSIPELIPGADASIGSGSNTGGSSTGSGGPEVSGGADASIGSGSNTGGSSTGSGSGTGSSCYTCTKYQLESYQCGTHNITDNECVSNCQRSCSGAGDYNACASECTFDCSRTEPTYCFRDKPYQTTCCD